MGVSKSKQGWWGCFVLSAVGVVLLEVVTERVLLQIVLEALKLLETLPSLVDISIPKVRALSILEGV